MMTRKERAENIVNLVERNLADDIQARTAQAVNRPTPEDALKAVYRACLILTMKCNQDREMEKILQGCTDLLEGKRYTEEAKAITGEGK